MCTVNQIGCRVPRPDARLHSPRPVACLSHKSRIHRDWWSTVSNNMSEWKLISPSDLNPSLLGKVFMVRSRGESGSFGVVGTLAWYGESDAEGVRICLHGMDPIVLLFGKRARRPNVYLHQPVPAPIIRQRSHEGISSISN